MFYRTFSTEVVIQNGPARLQFSIQWEMYNIEIHKKSPAFDALACPSHKWYRSSGLYEYIMSISSSGLDIGARPTHTPIQQEMQGWKTSLVNRHPRRQWSGLPTGTSRHLRRERIAVLLVLILQLPPGNIRLEPLVEVVGAHARVDNGLDDESDGQDGEGGQFFACLKVGIAVSWFVHPYQLEDEVGQSAK